MKQFDSGVKRQLDNRGIEEDSGADGAGPRLRQN